MLENNQFAETAGTTWCVEADDFNPVWECYNKAESVLIGDRKGPNSITQQQIDLAGRDPLLGDDRKPCLTKSELST